MEKAVIWEKMDIADSMEQNYPSVFRTWATVIPLIFLNLLTVVGNAIVLVMFSRMAKLRNFKNSFVASLAVADVLVGCTEPVSLIETAHGSWPGSLGQCHIFLLFRYSICYVSLLSILFISVDRWWSIHHPFSYRVRRTKRLAMWAIGTGWTLSFIIHICPFVSWEILPHNKDDFVDERVSISNTTSKPYPSINNYRLCLHPYKSNFIFTTFTFGLQYIVFLMILVWLNASVYFKISRRKATKIRRSVSTSEHFFHMSRQSSTDSENTISKEEACKLTGFFKRHGRTVTYKQFTPKRRHTLTPTVSHAAVSAPHLARLASSRRVSFDVTVLAQPLASRKECQYRRQSTGEELVRDLLIRQDKKAACSLGVLVLVLGTCWCPFCVCSIIYSYDSSLLPAWVLMVVQWLVAANSAANPFLYAVGNAEFRKLIKTWIGFVDKGPFKYHKAYLYHSIQLPTDQDTTKETVTSQCSKD